MTAQTAVPGPQGVAAGLVALRGVNDPLLSCGHSTLAVLRSAAGAHLCCAPCVLAVSGQHHVVWLERITPSVDSCNARG